MAQFLIRHKVELSLHSHVKLDTRQFQHVYSFLMKFQLNLTKNLEMPAVLKKGVYICCPIALKIHIVIENMLRKCCEQFCGILAVLKLCPTKSCATFFGPLDISCIAP